jgi:polyisoprenoid-binding protein YceI
MRHRFGLMLKKLVIAVVAVAVLVVGGTYVYIHFIQDDAPAKLTLEADSSTTTGGASTSDTSDLSGTWKAGTGSTAGYRAKEVLFGQSTTAVGRTPDVTGDLVIDGTAVSSAKVTVDMTTVTSDQGNRDRQFQGRIMDTATFPTSTFELTEPIDLGSIPAEGQTVTKAAKGKLTLHGTTKDVTVDLTAKRSAGTIQVQGSIPITFDDWGIPAPSFGPANVEDHGELEFLVSFTKA